MRLLLICVIAFVCIQLNTTPGHAAEFNLDYFNGVKWGSKLPQNGFKLFSKGSENLFYSRPADKSKLEGIPVEELTYTAQAGRFVAAHALFKGEKDYRRIRALCRKNFGDSYATLAGREHYRISRGTTFVTAMLQFDKGRGMVNFNCNRDRR